MSERKNILVANCTIQRNQTYVDLMEYPLPHCAINTCNGCATNTCNSCANSTCHAPSTAEMAFCWLCEASYHIFCVEVVRCVPFANCLASAERGSKYMDVFRVYPKAR